MLFVWMSIRHCSKSSAWLHIGADLQIITTKAAHVLYDNDRDSVGFDFGNHLLKSGSVELRTRDTIIREVDAVGKTVLFGVVLQYSLLIGDIEFDSP